jgi:hypothetical protein
LPSSFGRLLPVIVSVPDAVGVNQTNVLESQMFSFRTKSGLAAEPNPEEEKPALPPCQSPATNRGPAAGEGLAVGVLVRVGVGVAVEVGVTLAEGPPLTLGGLIFAAPPTTLILFPLIMEILHQQN